MSATVLVVDDEDGLRTMLAANLELEGFTTLEAQSAEAALKLLETNAVDLVLTDIRMPGKNGVELFRELRKSGVKVPVILMTGFAMEGLIQGALEEGAYAVLPKPFDVSHAVNTVASAAKRPMVLIVDDTRAVAETTKAGLDELGVNAAAVLSPDEALAAFATGKVDLCVVDLVMPGMSGVELAAKLREKDPRVSIIAISGQDVPELIREVAKVGIETFLRKPFGMRELVKSIAVARGRHRKEARK